jgi:hypothetical protein
MASAPSTQLSQDLFNLDNLFLNFAGYLFTGTFCFQLWIIACFPAISLTFPLSDYALPLTVRLSAPLCERSTLQK